MTTQPFTVEIIKRLFSVTEYHRLADAGILTEDDRVELIHGEIVEMSPINSPHADCVDKLSEWFILNFHGKAVTRVQNPITLSDHSEPEPDILLAKIKPEGYKSAHPVAEEVLIIVEVADTSLDKDRHIKLPLYATSEIQEAWLVNLNDQTIEIHTQPSAKGYAQIRIYHPGDTIETTLVKGLLVSDILD